jgi:hypothetical protein
LREGEGCAKDLRQAAIWSARGGRTGFFSALSKARYAFKNAKTEDLGRDFDQLCYSLGWGLFWYVYGTKDWREESDENKVFCNRCIDYYCEIVELQKKSILTFLLCWKEIVGVKDVGVVIAKMVWEGREDNLVKSFDEK